MQTPAEVREEHVDLLVRSFNNAFHTPVGEVSDIAGDIVSGCGAASAIPKTHTLNRACELYSSAFIGHDTHSKEIIPWMIRHFNYYCIIIPLRTEVDFRYRYNVTCITQWLKSSI